MPTNPYEPPKGEARAETKEETSAQEEGEEVVKLEISATGHPYVILCPDCEWEEFPGHAQKAVDDFGLTVTERIDSHTGERVWIAVQRQDRFCISWDHWMREVTIMAWQSTPDSSLLSLVKP